MRFNSSGLLRVIRSDSFKITIAINSPTISHWKIVPQRNRFTLSTAIIWITCFMVNWTRRERINELWKDLLREALRFQNMRRLKWSLNSFSSSSFCVHGNIWNRPLSFHNTRLIIPCNPCWVFDSNYQELKERPLTLKCISIFSLLASHL